MRAFRLALLAALTVSPAFAQGGMPDGVERLMTCGTVYSMQSDDAKAAGNEGGATEFFHRGDALIGQARSTMEAAGMAPDAIQNVEMNFALKVGFRYGAGEADAMLAECLAAEDSP
jgi:hypothetical protein